MGFLAHDFGGRDGNGRHAASDDVVHRDAVMWLLLMCWWCLLFVIYLSGGFGLGSEVLVASPRKVERQSLARIM